MSIDLSSAVAVITGAGSGIGRGTAHAFARRDTRVVVADVNADRAQAVAAELGDRGAAATCDVTKLADLEAARDLALERFGRVDLVMNNVGVLTVGPVEAVPFEAWQRLVDINLLGIVRSNLVFLPLLLEQGSGHIVNTASTAGLLPYGVDRIPYTTTKHAVFGLTEALALSLRPRGIGVSCLCPAGVKTNIREQATYYGTQAPPKGPAYKVSQPEDVGEMVAEGVAADRFLILTAPEVADDLREHGAGVDAYLSRLAAEGT